MKVALIKSFEPSTWVSCKFILPALEKCYRDLPQITIKSTNYTLEMSKRDLWEQARSIFKFNPGVIVFLDHQPPPPALLVALIEAYGSRCLPPVLVHVYGNFSTNLWRWLDIQDLLVNVRLRFLCSSPKQSKFVSNLISKGTQFVGTFPFPVHISACKEDEIAEGQTSVRDQLRLGREEFVFAYAGRISVQKNVLLLIKEFLKIRIKHNNVRLLIAGEFDQILSAHFGFRHNNGIYFELINEFLDSLSSELKASIIFLGHLNRRDLTRVYKETDCFVSLSTFHDEDFGMAPAEALCQGVPAILTNWAGYSGFRGPGVRFVEVRPSPLGAFINTLDLQNHFQAVLKNRENPQLLRGLIRSHFEQKFSVKSLSALLDSELANLSRIRLFEGFKNRAVLLSKGLGSPEAFGDDVHNMKDYMEVYAPYFN